MPGQSVKRKSWDSEKMLQAVSAVKDGRMGYALASKTYGVPKSTLERYVKSEDDTRTLVHKPLGRKPVFSATMERQLVDYLRHLDALYFGMRRSDVRRLAFQLAEKNDLPHRFNKEKRAAGKKWLRSFLKRHPELSCRTPQAISKAISQKRCFLPAGIFPIISGHR